MQQNIELIRKFYEAFSRLDSSRMNSCYADDIVFMDPAFGMLKGKEVFAMWNMLCKNAKDFTLAFEEPQDLGDGYYTCVWTASYTFSKTGNKVVNKIKANMKLVDGKIAEHSDAFSLHRWAAQALGFKGWLFGWNRFFQGKITNTAKRNLLNFMQKEGL